MTRRLPGKYVLIICLLLIAVCVSVYTYVGYHQPPNWDEEASIDIALGIRPAMVVGDHGRPTGGLHHEEVIGKPVFTNADYDRHNNAAGVVNAVMQDNSNSVLYYLVLHYWIKATGLPIFSLRLLSIFTALINLLLVAYIMSTCLPRQRAWAIVAVVLVGFNPVFLLQAFAIRSYMLCVCMLLLATIAWLRLIHTNHAHRNAWFLHSLFAMLALFCHYFAVAIILPQLLWLVVVAWRRRKNGIATGHWWRPLLALLILVVPLLVWYRVARTTGIPNMQLLDRTWQVAVQGGGYEATASNFIKLLFNTTAQMLGFDYQLTILPKGAWQSLAGLIMVMLAVMAFQYSRQARQDKQVAWVAGVVPSLWNPLLYTWLGAVVIYAGRSWLSGHFMLFHRTYLVFLLPWLLLGLVWMLATSGRVVAAFRWGRLALGLLLLVNVVGFALHTWQWGQSSKARITKVDIGKNHNTIHNPWVDMPALAQQLKQSAATDSIVYANWKTAHRFNYYLHQWSGTQHVDTTLGGQSIFLYQGANKLTVTVAGK